MERQREELRSELERERSERERTTTRMEESEKELERTRRRAVEVERTIQELTEKSDESTLQRELEKTRVSLTRKEEMTLRLEEELKKKKEEESTMQETFRAALKEAMERAAKEAEVDAEGQWRARLEETRSEYLAREQQLTSDAGAARSRLREASDRLIELERHSAQSEATLDVVKRENVSLQSSLDHARNGMTSMRIQQQSQQNQSQPYPMQHQHQHHAQQYGAPPPAPQYGSATSFYNPSLSGTTTTAAARPPASIEESQKILAIQNQVSCSFLRFAFELCVSFCCFYIKFFFQSFGTIYPTPHSTHTLPLFSLLSSLSALSLCPLSLHSLSLPSLSALSLCPLSLPSLCPCP